MSLKYFALFAFMWMKFLLHFSMYLHLHLLYTVVCMFTLYSYLRLHVSI